MLSKDGTEVDAAVDDRRRDILIVCGVAFAVTVLLSFYLAGTIARPIRRLARAADQVRSGKGRQFELPDFSRRGDEIGRSEEHTSELQSLMRISYAVFCLKKKKTKRASRVECT